MTVLKIALGRQLRSPLWFWLSVMTLFLLVHLTLDNMVGLAIHAVQYFKIRISEDAFISAMEALCQVKYLLFVCSFAAIALHCLAHGQLGFSGEKLRKAFRCLFAAALMMVALAALCYYPDNASMGEIYARISQNPYLQFADVYNKRLLVPAIAHVLHLRGGWLYYLYSLALTLVFTALLYDWCRRNADLRLWQLLSLCTCSFVMFQFQFPGYPEVLVFIFMILVMSDHTPQEVRLPLLIMALVAHESSVFMGALLAVRFLDKTRRNLYFVAVALYVLALLAAYGFNPGAAFAQHDVDNMSGIAWVFSHPSTEMLGIAISWKMLWLMVPVALYRAAGLKEYADMLFIAAGIGVGILLTFMGVDTSRLVGFIFPAMLVSLRIVMKDLQGKPLARAVSAIFILNLLMPSFYVGLNTGVVVRPGIYGKLYQLGAQLMSPGDN